MARLSLDDFLPYQLSITDNLVSQLVERAYDKLGLSVQEWRVVAVLGEIDGLSQQGIVDRTRMDKLTVSRAARALEGRRLVVRRADDEDKRALKLSLSRTGRRLYDRVIPAALAKEKIVRAALSKTELRELSRMLEKIRTRCLDSIN